MSALSGGFPGRGGLFSAADAQKQRAGGLTWTPSEG